MNHINIRKLGLAFGLTGTWLYFGCAVVMLSLRHDSTVKFFNSLLLFEMSCSGILSIKMTF